MNLNLPTPGPHHDEQVPRFAFNLSLQANIVFMLSLLIMALTLGWTMRDHKRRLEKLAAEEQEDKLYLIALVSFIMLLFVGTMYYRWKSEEYESSRESPFTHMLIEEIVERAVPGNFRTRSSVLSPFQRQVQSHPWRLLQQAFSSYPWRRLLEGGDKPEYVVAAWSSLTLMTLFALWHASPTRYRRNLILMMSKGLAVTSFFRSCFRCGTTTSLPTQTHLHRSDSTKENYSELQEKGPNPLDDPFFQPHSHKSRSAYDSAFDRRRHRTRVPRTTLNNNSRRRRT